MNRYRLAARRLLSGLVAAAVAVVVFVYNQRLDLLVLFGLALWAYAFWAASRPAALGVPAAVLVWCGLPMRPPFISR